MNTLPADRPGCNSTGRPGRRLRRRPATPNPDTPPDPLTCPLCSGDRDQADAEREAIARADRAAKVARREVLVGTSANRIGHEVLATARHLAGLLDRFQAAATGPEPYQRLRRAGLAPDGPTTGEEHGPDHFATAADDALCFAWVLDQFADLFGGELLRDPNMPAQRTRRR